MRLMFDIETDGLLDGVTKVHCLWIQDIDTKEMWGYADQPGYSPLSAGFEKLSQATLLSGHNVLTYDIPVLAKLYPKLELTSNIFDTLVMARLLWADIEVSDYARLDRGFPAALIGRHSLKAWGYRIGELKGAYGGDQGAWENWSQQMHEYCQQDVIVNGKLFDVIQKKNPSPESVKLEHEFQHIIFQQERFGFRFDEEKAGKLYAALVKKKQELTAILHKSFEPRVQTMKKPAGYRLCVEPETQHDAAAYLTFPTKKAFEQWRREDVWNKNFKATELEALPPEQRQIPFNPGSRDEAAERLIEKYGWEPIKFTDTGKPQVDESVLEALPYPEARPLSEYLLVEKRLGQLAEGKKSWLKLVKNGRIHGRVITNGAVTGRCTHKDPNVSQTPAVQKNKAGEVLHGLEGGYGWECRELFTVDPGCLLVGADASGLELRCLAHYMARYDGGEYGRVLLEGDIHTVNQKAAGLATRAEAKTFIYAYLYGAGDEKLGSIPGVTDDEIASLKRDPDVWSDAFTKEFKKRKYIAKKKGEEAQPPDDRTVAMIIKGGELRSRFEDKTPALAKLKAKIAETICDDRGRVIAPLRGLDGRMLRVRSTHAALNTLLQSAGGLLVKKATTILYDHCIERGWKFGREFANVAHIHDEVQLQAKAELAEDIGKLAVESIKEAGEYFSFRIKLDGEYKVGRNWAETH